MKIETKTNYVLTLNEKEIGFLKYALERFNPMNDSTRIIANDLLAEIAEFEKENA